MKSELVERVKRDFVALNVLRLKEKCTLFGFCFDFVIKLNFKLNVQPFPCTADSLVMVTYIAK